MRGRHLAAGEEMTVDALQQWLWTAGISIAMVPMLAPLPFLAAAGGSLAALVLGSGQEGVGRWGYRLLWCLVPFGLPAALVTFGTAYHSDVWLDGPVPAWPGRVVQALAWAQVPAAAAMLGYFRGARLFVLGVAVAQGWLCFAAGLVSYMAVTGSWI
jgi:hypothetical protein